MKCTDKQIRRYFDMHMKRETCPGEFWEIMALPGDWPSNTELAIKIYRDMLPASKNQGARIRALVDEWVKPFHLKDMLLSKRTQKPEKATGFLLTNKT